MRESESAAHKVPLSIRPELKSVPHHSRKPHNFIYLYLFHAEKTTFDMFDIEGCWSTVVETVNQFDALKAALDKDTITNDYVQNSFQFGGGKSFLKTGKKEGMYLFFFFCGPACDLYLASGEVGRGIAALSPAILYFIVVQYYSQKSCKNHQRIHDDDSIVPLILSVYTYEIIDKVRQPLVLAVIDRYFERKRYIIYLWLL